MPGTALQFGRRCLGTTSPGHIIGLRFGLRFATAPVHCLSRLLSEITYLGCLVRVFTERVVTAQAAALVILLRLQLCVSTSVYTSYTTAELNGTPVPWLQVMGL